MSGIMKAIMVTCMVMLILAAGISAMAAKPAYTGLKCPPAVDGKTGAVTGRVTTAINATGMGNAYVAIVNASNVSEEYFNTTSDAYGYYQFVGVNATYNAINTSDVGPNGPTPYKIYAYHPVYGDGYSAAFGVDASGGSSSGGGGVPPITVTSTPTAVATPVSSPVASPIVTPADTPVPTPLATGTPLPPTATPQPTPYVVPQALSLLAAGCVAAWIVSRRKNN
jgi:hypothetical protein